jgi:hypothetical protein
MICELERVVFLGEENVVVLAAIEGRVEVDEVDGLGLDVLAENAEVVAVIELVLLHCRAILAGMQCGRNLIVGVGPGGLGSCFSSVPRTYVRGYHMPPLRGWGLVVRSASSYAGSIPAARYSSRDPSTPFVTRFARDKFRSG